LRLRNDVDAQSDGELSLLADAPRVKRITCGFYGCNRAPLRPVGIWLPELDSSQ